MIIAIVYCQKDVSSVYNKSNKAKTEEEESQNFVVAVTNDGKFNERNKVKVKRTATITKKDLFNVEYESRALARRSQLSSIANNIVGFLQKQHTMPMTLHGEVIDLLIARLFNFPPFDKYHMPRQNVKFHQFNFYDLIIFYL
jgi:hypothetical protein